MSEKALNRINIDAVVYHLASHSIPKLAGRKTVGFTLVITEIEMS